MERGDVDQTRACVRAGHEASEATHVCCNRRSVALIARAKAVARHREHVRLRRLAKAFVLRQDPAVARGFSRADPPDHGFREAALQSHTCLSGWAWSWRAAS